MDAAPTANCESGPDEFSNPAGAGWAPASRVMGASRRRCRRRQRAGGREPSFCCSPQPTCVVPLSTALLAPSIQPSCLLQFVSTGCPAAACCGALPRARAASAAAVAASAAAVAAASPAAASTAPQVLVDPGHSPFSAATGRAGAADPGSKGGSAAVGPTGHAAMGSSSRPLG